MSPPTAPPQVVSIRRYKGHETILVEYSILYSCKEIVNEEKIRDHFRNKRKQFWMTGVRPIYPFSLAILLSYFYMHVLCALCTCIYVL